MTDAFTSVGPKQPQFPWSAEAFQVQWNRTRYYTDPLPACSIADVTTDKWPGFSSIKPSKPFRKGVTVDGVKRTIPLDLYTAGEWLTEHVNDTWEYDQDYKLKLGGFYDLVNVARDRAFARGHAIHAAAEATLLGQPTPQWALDNPDAAPYLPHVQAWIDANVADVICIEAVVINRVKGYGGTGDAWLRLKSGIDCYVDWKSRGEDSSHGVYDEEIAQCGAYNDPAGYMIGPSADRVTAVRQSIPHVDYGCVVSIRPDGTETFYFGVDEGVAVFGHMLDSYRSLSLAGKTATKAKKVQPQIAVPDAISPVSVEQPVAGAGSLAANPPATNLTRVEQLRQRCRVIAGINRGVAHNMGYYWPDKAPMLTDTDITDADLDIIEAHVTKWETHVSAPFPEPVPNPQPVVEVRLEHYELVPLPNLVPDEGPLVELTDPAFTGMTQRYLAVTDKTAQAWMAETIGESLRAGRSIHLATSKSLRRIRIVDGLVTLALHDLRDAARGIAAVALDHDLARDTRHPLGAVVSLLDATQAAAFAGMCQAATEDLKQGTAA